MSPALEELVREAQALTSAATPKLLEDGAPVLDEAALASKEGDPYFVGLIGGKDVGKSALINALVGKAITAVTSHGAGTEIAVAYAHVSRAAWLRELLDAELAGQYRIETHEISALRRQVLLDLPDIDSKYAAHLQVTRAMLRHMLYPIWVVSVEKYADLQPRQMLARVAEGNTPANFIFCLNKVDQLKGSAAGNVSRRTGSAQSVPAPGATINAIPADTTSHAAVAAEAPAIAAEAPAVAAVASTVAAGIPALHAPIASGPALAPSQLPPAPSPLPPVQSPPTLRQSPPAPALSPLQTVAADYARRVQETLRLADPPRVYLISAKNPTDYELPDLRLLVMQQRTEEEVRLAKRQAAAQQDKALLEWLAAQELPLRAQRLARLGEDAEELIQSRVGQPIIERLVPRLLDDPATRTAMTDQVLAHRLRAWPLMGVVHAVMQPLFVILRTAAARHPAPAQHSEALVDAIMQESGESVTALVQSAFAQLRQTQPAVAPLYAGNRLWEDMPAEIAAGQLRRNLAQATQRQRQAAVDRLGAAPARSAVPVRWLLTIGALLWFPIVQPMLAELTGAPGVGHTVLSTLIGVLGVDYLLKSAGFLAIYFAVLWIALRWNTHHRVSRLLSRWQMTEFPDPSVNLATQTRQWIRGLTAPIRTAGEQMQSLARRAQDVKAQLVADTSLETLEKITAA